MANLPEHITVTEDGPRRWAVECASCKMSMSTESRTMGPNLAASFVIQHAVHTKDGLPAGLTAGGKPRAAAIKALS